jgi:hypothetical protein
LKESGALPQRLGTELEGVEFVGLSRQKPLLRGAEADRVRKVGLRHLLPFGNVDQQPRAFLHPLHHQGFAAMELQTVTLLETDAAQGGAAHCVLPLVPGCWKENLHPCRIRLHHNTQSQFWFRVADNPLSWVHPFKFHREGREPTPKREPQEA